MAACYQIARWCYFTLNFLFCMCGLGIIGVALWLLLDGETILQIQTAMHGEFSYELGILCYGLLGFGILLTLLSFLACCGALIQSACMLLVFVVLVLIGVGLQVAACLLVYFYTDVVKGYFEDSMRTTIIEKYDAEFPDSDINILVDRMQTRFGCCGVGSYSDWLSSAYSKSYVGGNNPLDVYQGQMNSAVGKESPVASVTGVRIKGRVPLSCCNDLGLANMRETCANVPENDGKNAPSFFNRQGCSRKIEDEVLRYKYVFIIALSSILALQLVSLAVAICLFAGARNRKL